MNAYESFPQKLALGEYFCNRGKEREYLAKNIQGVRPTLIISPRRYGKTSLGMTVIRELKLPYAHIDLFPFMDIAEVEAEIINGAAAIIAATENSAEKAMKVVAHFFSELNVSFKIIQSKIEVDVNKLYTPSARTLMVVLQDLDSFLKKKKMKGVLFLDEFQRLQQLEASQKIEGILRNSAQKSTNLVFLFSGSNRHLLNKMFDDSMRPLYKLCYKITLKRMDHKVLHDFITKTIFACSGKKADVEGVETILHLTENHTYYVNVLCSRLLRMAIKLDIKSVEDCWRNYALEERASVFKELENLSQNQFKVLAALSRHGKTRNPMGDDFLNAAHMALSSMRQALTVLCEKDYIYKDNEDYYTALDPLLKYILAHRPQET